MSSSSSPTVVSAPGKVLIAGGYLVLDPAYRGVVVSTSSRFYSVVQDAQGGAASANRIVVRSPQFTNATWAYDVKFEDGFVNVEPSSGSTSQNKFVHLALLHTLKLAAEIRESKGAEPLSAALASGLDIAIAGDNDFYSQRAKLSSLGLQPTLSDLAKIPPFSPVGVALADVNKTGLGSSAALITSLVSALLLHLGAISRAHFASADADRRLAHHAAQFVHCLAQGKVGSGFDVSAAVFGSHMYRRFGEGVIKPLLSMDASQLAKEKLYPVLSPTNTAWDYSAASFTLPPFARLILGDVSVGSETPSMVKDVLKWRNASETAEAANRLWNEINASNQALANALQKLSFLASQIREEYEATIVELSSKPPSEWSPKHGQTPLQTPDESRTVAAGLYEVHQISENIRAGMREMGKAAKVDIEPAEQTRLLDTCMSIDGVVAGGVPGAGGYDAIWLLVLDPPGAADPPVARVEKAWSAYEKANPGVSISPLLARQSEEQGARVEELEQVRGLKDAIAPQ